MAKQTTKPAHGNAGRRNAAKPEGTQKQSHLALRIHQHDRDFFEAAAAAQGIRLTTWVEQSLRETASRELGRPAP